MCERERCPFAVVGIATEERQLRVLDPEHDNYPVDMPMEVLLGKPPKMHRDVQRQATPKVALDLTDITLDDAAERVLRQPTVG
jgi:phosphoribosylformylglycinamidine synthase